MFSTGTQTPPVPFCATHGSCNMQRAPSPAPVPLPTVLNPWSDDACRDYLVAASTEKLLRCDAAEVAIIFAATVGAPKSRRRGDADPEAACVSAATEDDRSLACQHLRNIKARRVDLDCLSARDLALISALLRDDIGSGPPGSYPFGVPSEAAVPQPSLSTVLAAVTTMRKPSLLMAVRSYYYALLTAREAASGAPGRSTRRSSASSQTPPVMSPVAETVTEPTGVPEPKQNSASPPPAQEEPHATAAQQAQGPPHDANATAAYDVMRRGVARYMRLFLHCAALPGIAAAGGNHGQAACYEDAVLAAFAGPPPRLFVSTA